MPEAAQTEELDDLTEWLGELVRQVDSSLLDEWEALAHPDADGALAVERPDPSTAPPVTANARAFRVLVRNELFRRVELAALERYDDLGALDGAARLGPSAPGPTRWSGYWAEHESIGTGPNARGPALLVIDENPMRPQRVWTVRQIFDDPDGDRDWAISGEVDLDASDEAGTAVLRVLDVGPATATP